MTNITEAVELYLETLDEDERAELLSHQVITKSLEVSVA